MRSAGPGDDQARFLADLRALRDMAAIGHDELAARAHYPSDILKEAENGPLLPGLPILTAYVRACDGDVPDWEERWRRLNSEIPEDPDLPVRPPGASPAAVAGARAGVGIAPPEVYDPERIKAALRGGLGRSGQDGSAAGRRNGSRKAGARSKSASGWGTTPGWDAASDETTTVTNGNHTASSWSREPFDVPVTADPAESAGPPDQFRWLPDEEPASPQSGTGLTDLGVAETAPADAGKIDTEPAETSMPAEGQAEPVVTEWTTRWDDATKPFEGTDFWSPSADPQQPVTAADQVDEQTYSQDSWSASAQTEATSAPQPAPAADTARSQLGAESAPDAGTTKATPPRTSAGSTGATGSAASTGSTPSASGSTPTARFATTQPLGHQAATHHKDRLFPARLLLIIVIAALIGSVLVLLLK